VTEQTPGPETLVDELLTPDEADAFDSGVEKNRMLASLQARMFGAQETLRLGRFELGRRRGAGAMGVVYEARDPQLDRKVALKVLRATSLDPSRVERLALEARSLAKLRHPNVVTVYEVGQDGDDRFIVMDLVQGETLRVWLQTPRDWEDIVRMFIGAGEGLWAAHEAGLVHRDFKPDNVLVEDGQPKVVDFGLAAAVDDPAETTHPRTSAPAAIDRFTQTEAFVGTPAYMAPEQFEGKASPAADQYAFCVALFEALAGHRPHADAESSGLDALILARSNAPAPNAPERAPRWLRRVIAQGLATRPSRRWPSMSALLDALRRVDRSSRGGMKVAAGVLGVAALGVGLGRPFSGDQAVDPCATASAPIEAAWSAARQTDLGRAFARTELAYADDTWQRVVPHLDDYARAWSGARQRACVADLASPDPQAPLNLARVRCLDRRRADFESLLETFASADAKIVDRAVDAATTIPSLDQCAEATLLREQMERRGGYSPASPAFYASLSAADAAYRTGNDEAALRDAAPILREARAVGDHELVALAALVLAKAHQRHGDIRASLEFAETAVEAAERLGDTRVRVRAQLRLLSVLAERRGFEPAHRIVRFAGAAMERLEDPVAFEATLGELESRLLLLEGKPNEALAPLDRLDPVVAPFPRLRGRILDQRSETLEALGRHDAAITIQHEALALLETRLGAGTPRTIQARMGLTTSLANTGRVDEALSQAREALRDADHALGADSLIAARARATLAMAMAVAGDVEASEPLFRDAAKVLEARLGPEHPDAAAGWINLSRVLPALGKSAEAVEVLEHAATILRHTLPADHTDFLFIQTNLAEAHLQLQQWQEALIAARAAEAIVAKHLSKDSERMIPIRTQVGTAQRGLGNLDASRTTLEAVLATLKASDGRAALIAVARYELALTRAELGDGQAAKSLMLSARQAFEDDGTHAGRVQAIDAWLSKR